MFLLVKNNSKCYRVLSLYTGESEKLNCFGGVLLKPGKISRRNLIKGGILAIGGIAAATAYSFIESQWIKFP